MRSLSSTHGIRLCLAAVATSAMIASPTSSRAQQTVVVPGPTVVVPRAPVVVAPQQALTAPLKGIVKELRSGPLLIHGNYCGIGNRPGRPPTDALDAACMRHDACTKTGSLPSCACDDRLRAEATAISRDPRTPPDIKIVAAATAASMAVLVCKYTPHG